MNILYKTKKSLGQNFLIDKNIINKIIKIGNITKDNQVIEIGSGNGSLTTAIIEKKPKKLLGVEIDKRLSSFLKNKFKNEKNVKIINADILKLIDKNILKENVIVFGNLPYNISTQILASFIMLKKWPPWFDVLVFMFQKEVGDRIIAKNNTKDFSRLTVLSNWRLDIKKHFDISKNCFYPKPKINSTVLSFKPKKNNKFNLINPKTLEKTTRILFSNKRKMINKNFNKLFDRNNSVAKKLNIDLSKRPAELTTEIYYKIAIEYEKLFS